MEGRGEVGRCVGARNNHGKEHEQEGTAVSDRALTQDRERVEVFTKGKQHAAAAAQGLKLSFCKVINVCREVLTEADPPGRDAPLHQMASASSD